MWMGKNTKDWGCVKVISSAITLKRKSENGNKIIVKYKKLETVGAVYTHTVSFSEISEKFAYVVFLQSAIYKSKKYKNRVGNI